MSTIPPGYNRDPKHDLDENIKLFAANGTEIKTFGEKYLTLNIGLRRQFSWKFIIADIKTPLIGADFLSHYDLLVDPKRNKLSTT